MYNLTKLERDFLVDLEFAVEKGIVTDKQVATDMLSAIIDLSTSDNNFNNILALDGGNGNDNVFEGYHFVRNESELNQVYADCVYDSANEDYSKEKKIGSFNAVVRYAYQNHDDAYTQTGEDRWHIYIIFKLFD